METFLQALTTIVSLALWSLPTGEGEFFDYCELDCNSTKHTVCEYPAGGGPSCSNNPGVYLSVKEKKWILEMHNSFRQSVAMGRVKNQPKASNMMKLAWDGEIGMFAKRWADQCGQLDHDTCRTAMDGMDVGQNMYLGSYTFSGTVNVPSDEKRSQRIQTILKTWEGEVDHMDPTEVHRFNPNTSSQVANYTQMVWADTVFMGCGYTEFAAGGNRIDFRFICNYKRKGDVPYHRVYRVGDPCSSCPPRANCSKTWPGLCWDGSENYFLDKEVDGQPAAARPHRLILLLLVVVLLCLFTNHILIKLL